MPWLPENPDRRDKTAIRVRAMNHIVWYRRRWVAASLFGLAFAVPFFAALAAMETCAASAPHDRIAESAKTHHIAFQVNSDDPVAMKHAITNSLNALKNYREKGEPAAIEIVAYGPGVHMFRADTSPVKDLSRRQVQRLRQYQDDHGEKRGAPAGSGRRRTGRAVRRRSSRRIAGSRLDLSAAMTRSEPDIRT